MFADKNSMPYLHCRSGWRHIIRIVQPLKPFAANTCRNKFCAVNLQATCTKSLKFTSVSSGWSGSMNDARVFENSERTNPTWKTGGHWLPHNWWSCLFPVWTFIKIISKSRCNWGMYDKQKKIMLLMAQTLAYVMKTLFHFPIRTKTIQPYPELWKIFHWASICSLKMKILTVKISLHEALRLDWLDLA